MRSYDVLGHRVRPLLVALACAALGVAGATVVSGTAPWWVLPLGVLGPDLAFIAGIGQQAQQQGLMPPRAVPFCNVVHHPATAVLAVVASVVLTGPTALAASLAWLSHIVWDRGVGYGLRDSHGAVVEAKHRRVSTGRTTRPSRADLRV